MQYFERCRIFREFFTHPDHRLSKIKRTWVLSKKGTDHCFHIADTIDDVNGWLKCCCCWCWSWRCIGKYRRGSIVPFNVIGSSWPRNLVASQLFNLCTWPKDWVCFTKVATPLVPYFIGSAFLHNKQIAFPHWSIFLVQSYLVIFGYLDKSISTFSMSTALSRFKLLAILI